MAISETKKYLERRPLFHCFDAGRIRSTSLLISRTGWDGGDSCGEKLDGDCRNPWILDQSIYWYLSLIQ